MTVIKPQDVFDALYDAHINGDIVTSRFPFHRAIFDFVDGMSFVLDKEVDSTDARRSYYACHLTLLLCALEPDAFDQQQLQRATDLIRFGLTSEILEERRFVVGITPHAAAQTFHAELTALLTDNDCRVAVYAACAISKAMPKGDPPTEGVILALDRGLRSDDENARRAAQIELGRQNILVEDTIADIVARLGMATTAQMPWILSTISAFGTKATIAIHDVLKICADAEIPLPIRVVAARTVFDISRGSEVAYDSMVAVLQASLSANEPHLSAQVLWALARGRFNNHSAVDLYCSLLQSEHVDVRCAAASAIARSGRAAALKCLPMVIERATQEPKVEVIADLARAMAAAGSDFVGAAIMQLTDYRLASPFALAIVEMGDEGVSAFADAIVTANQLPIETQLLLVNIMRDLRISSAAVIPFLLRLLDRSDTIMQCAVFCCLSYIHPIDDETIRAIVNLMADIEEDAALWAERALWGAGGRAIPIIESALERNRIAGSDRLERVLDGLIAIEDRANEYRWFAELGNDMLLERFVMIADILHDEGPKSFADIAIAISARNEGQKDIVGARSLSNVVQQLNRLRPTPLTTHKPRQKGDLTDAGKYFRRFAKSYLKRRGMRPPAAR